MKKAFRKMLAILMALTMIVANFAMLAVYAEDGAAHAEEYKCPGVGEEHDKSNCDWTKGKTVDPVCANPGYTTYYCKGCNAPFMADIIPGDSDAAHNPGKPVTTEPADCTTPGSIVVTCQNEGCGKVLSETVIPAPGHEMVEDGDGCRCANCDEKTQAKHTYVFVEITKYPTKDGRGEAKFECTNCGKEMLNGEVSKLCEEEEHEWVYVDPQEATCQQEGFLGYIYCTVCDEAFFKEVAEKLNHKWNNGEIVEDSTCTKTGVMKYTCTTCTGNTPATYTETIPMKAHVAHVYGDCVCEEKFHSYGNDTTLIGTNKPTAERDPDCKVEGYKVYTCAVCEIVMEELNKVLPKTGHSYDLDMDGKIDEGVTPTSTVGATCTDKGSETYTCAFCLERATFDVAAKRHTEVIFAAQAPTCTTAGWTEGKYCSVCSGFASAPTAYNDTTGTWLVAPTAKEALDHSFTKDFFQPANCTYPSESYKVCVRCDIKDPNGEVVYGTGINPDNHILGRKIITPATCTKEGLAKVWCTLCDKNDFADEVIPANGHKFDNGVEAIAPTCTTKGWTRYTCTVADCDGCVDANHTHTNACKSYLVENIAAKDHTWGDITKTDDDTQCVVTPENCKDNGSVAAKCQDCDAVATATTVANKTVYMVIKANPAKHHDGIKNVASMEVLRAPTCVVKGLNAYKCSLCGKTYTLETVYGDCVNPGKIDKADYADLFCNADELVDKIIAKCEACGAYYEVTEGQNTEDPAIYTRIYTDEETLPEGETVTLKIHRVTEHEGKYYDCMTNGYDAYEKCAKCGYTTYEDKIAIGHVFMDDQDQLNVIDYEDVSCTTWGYKIVKCLVCDQLIMVDLVPPTGHSYTPDGAPAAITGIFSCKDERLLEALEGELLEDDILCDVCDEPIHNIAYLPEVVACDGVYRTAYCVENCGYEYIELLDAFDVNLHDPSIITEYWFDYCALNDPELVKPATATRGNVWEATCKFCGETMTYTDDEIVDELTFVYEFVQSNEDFELLDGVYEEYDGEDYYYAMISNSNIFALVVSTKGPGVEVSSIGLKLNYDATRLEFISGTVTNANFDGNKSVVYGNNKVVAGSSDADATLTILAVTEDGGIGIGSDKDGNDTELAVIFFRVLTKETDWNDYDASFEFEVSAKSEVLDENNDNIEADFEGYSDLDYWFYKLGDINVDETISLADLNELALMIDLDYEGQYYPNADINRDGSVDILDYELLVDFYLEKITYLEMCGI